MSSDPTLAEQLGYRATDRLLIISCDELGLSHASNTGSYRALRDGQATSAGLMVPTPWAREAAARYHGEDVGVHLTLNAEWDLYRWGPITRAPSLHDGDGGFPRTQADLWDHADLDEVRRELRAQIDRAILWGFDVSHLSSYLNGLDFRPEFFDIQLELALDYQLPMRLMPESYERVAGFPFRRLARAEQVVSPDHFLRADQQQSARSVAISLLAELRPGVTELVFRPAIDTPELRAFAKDWDQRVDDADYLTGHGLGDQLRDAGITLISYRTLRSLQRSDRTASDPTQLI